MRVLRPRAESPPRLHGAGPAGSPGRSRRPRWRSRLSRCCDQRALRGHPREGRPVPAPAPRNRAFFSTFETTETAVSPDGTQIAFVSSPYAASAGRRGIAPQEAPGSNGIWIRDLASLESRPVPGTEDANFALLVSGRPVARLLHARKAEADPSQGWRGRADLRRPAPAEESPEPGAPTARSCSPAFRRQDSRGAAAGGTPEGDRSGAFAGRGPLQLALVSARREALPVLRAHAQWRRTPQAVRAGKASAHARADELVGAIQRSRYLVFAKEGCPPRPEVRPRGRPSDGRSLRARRARGLLLLERAGFLRRVAIGDARLPASRRREPADLDRPLGPAGRIDRAGRQLSEPLGGRERAPGFLRSNTAGNRDLRRLVVRPRARPRDARHVGPGNRDRPGPAAGRQEHRLFGQPRWSARAVPPEPGGRPRRAVEPEGEDLPGGSGRLTRRTHSRLRAAWSSGKLRHLDPPARRARPPGRSWSRRSTRRRSVSRPTAGSWPSSPPSPARPRPTSCPTPARARRSGFLREERAFSSGAGTARSSSIWRATAA